MIRPLPTLSIWTWIMNHIIDKVIECHEQNTTTEPAQHRAVFSLTSVSNLIRIQHDECCVRYLSTWRRYKHVDLRLMTSHAYRVSVFRLANKIIYISGIIQKSGSMIWVVFFLYDRGFCCYICFFVDIQIKQQLLLWMKILTHLELFWYSTRL